MQMAPPRVSVAIGIATVAVSLGVFLFGAPDLSVRAGFIPGRVTDVVDMARALPVWITPLSATLLHGSVVHLLFNVLVLAYCGRSVEPVIGGIGLAVLYVAGAYAAALGQLIPSPHDMTPMIGASGAVSALLAAHALLYGERPDHGRYLSAGLLHILWLALAWIGIQLLTQLAFNGTVAVAAHIGGFLAGLVLLKPLLKLRHVRA
ncbi:rhomboid family intramembrane serine protease [Sphingomonas sp. ID0503]|uniref:rhomboid family intramembrane serine protease n=1 Tax=Sphingomonas sp. ID0503 TaxID=3399691 RepID=UPI003AFB2B67